MNTRILSALILCTALFAACDDKEEFEPSRTKLIPSEITVEVSADRKVTANTYIFTYDDSHRITKIAHDDYSRELEYEGDDIRETITNGSKITETDYKREGGKIKYDDSEITITNKLQASVTADAEYSYDKRGNLVNMKYKLWNDERMQAYKFGFDNRNGVFRYVATPSWYLTTQLAIAPNVLGHSIYYHSFYNNCNKEGSSTSGYEYEIEYNEYDYPVRITRESVGFIPGNKIVYTITYREAGAEI